MNTRLLVVLGAVTGYLITGVASIPGIEQPWLAIIGLVLGTLNLAITVWLTGQPPTKLMGGSG